MCKIKEFLTIFSPKKNFDQDSVAVVYLCEWMFWLVMVAINKGWSECILSHTALMTLENGNLLNFRKKKVFFVGGGGQKNILNNNYKIFNDLMGVWKF